MIGVRFPAGLGISLFDIVSRPAMGPTQLSVQWVPGGSFSEGKAAEA
jgi:hypothetical protein